MAVARDGAEHGGVRDSVAAQAVRAMHAARVLARGEQSLDGGAPIGGELHPAHHVVRGGHHLDQPAREIESAIAAAIDHSLELRAHVIGPRCDIAR
jgi:hypothetical protein